MSGSRFASGGTSLAIRHGSPASSSKRAPRSLPRPSVSRNRQPSSPLPGTRGLRRFRACGCTLREAPFRRAPSAQTAFAGSGRHQSIAGCGFVPSARSVRRSRRRRGAQWG